MTACLLALALAASPPKLAVLQVAAGEGVPASTAAAVTESLVAEVRRRSGAEVVTQREIASILSLENQKAMLGCSTDACMAELGGALGADRLVAADLARLGESFLFHVRVVEVKKVRVAAQSDRRLRGGTIDDVLDVLPAMVAEIFPPAQAAEPAVPAAPGPPPAAVAAVTIPPPPPGGAAEAPPAATTGAAPAPAVSAGAAAAAWVEEPEALPRALRERLYVLTDDAGLYVALAPFQGIDTPLYAGTRDKLYRQRLVGGSQQGRLAFDRVFWEPRVSSGSQSLLAMRGGNATLTCGGRTIPLRVLGQGAARRLLAAAQLFAPPFRRVPQLLARDDEGAYFYVDAARDPASGGPAAPPDYRLRYGRQGSLGTVAVAEAIADGGGLVIVTASGRLVDRGGAAEWVSGTGRLPLTSLDVRDSAPFIYGGSGPYAGARLGTPCDGRF
jgi:hypothetical protein